MDRIIVVRTGYKYRGENWRSFIDGYFKDVISAEKYLEKEGYVFTYDDIYSKVDEEETVLLAKIESLKYIE